MLKYTFANLWSRLRRDGSVGRPKVGESMELQLERYLRQVEGGEEVIAAQKRELTNMRRETKAALDIREEARLMRLERKGEIILSSGVLEDDFWDLPMPEDPEGEVMKALLEDREDRF